jgi:hypothetical protein
MEHDFTSKAASCSVSQEVPHILLKPKVYCRIHKTQSVVRNLRQVSSHHPNLFARHFEVLLQFTPKFSQCSFPIRFLVQNFVWF